MQWLSNEAKGRSVVPTAFRWLSLAGEAALLADAIWRRDLALIAGQGFGLLVHARNLLPLRAAPGPTWAPRPARLASVRPPPVTTSVAHAAALIAGVALLLILLRPLCPSTRRAT